ncbi:Prolyl tripeptidyl peptidase precursor [Anatilimnocola aggregata]|uniref:Prolyl tripeptidyl peptidase n=1 Tax=Anatilimnocola aggregata TaxID=2528021 RepID=A0A517YH90_9BACT|nr:S9 family peptidase [Anatilimnocola aggregata]QDU29588.1 Prolyl tripeptidyl peptidase precursor [Anatilimnocola aggregata]
MMRRLLFVALPLVLAAICLQSSCSSIAAAQGAAAEVPLIPRARFFGNPEKARARLSHDGKRLAYVAPVEGVLNVWASPDDNPANAKPITFDKHRGVVSYMWAYTNKHILYTQDKNGDEDNHVYAINLDTGKITDLTPIEKIAAQIEGFSENFPEEILVGINDRGERHYHDIYKININTAEKKLVKLNPGFAGFLIDDNYEVRLAMNFSPTGGQVYLQPDGMDGWKPFMEIGVADAMTTSPAGFNKEGDKLYMLDSRGRNTAALKLMTIKTGESELLAENDRADISGALAHPTKKTVQAVSYTFTRTDWKILDPAIQPDFDYLKTVTDGELQITGRTLDDTRWSVAYVMDNGPVQFYIYDRAPNRKVTYLFSSNRELEKLPLVKMHPQVIKSRDGLELVSYLTLPKGSDADGDGRPNEPLPMVLNVHGGPWARDDWGYDPEHQLLANRGYAVLAVNYRGSTGFGKEFINAADKEWAGKMHNDLIDAVNWVVDNKIARKDKVAIMGGSYGGYATLVGLTFTPDVFACGVDVVGPSSLITLLSNPPPYWMPFMPVMKVRVGDHQSEEGKKFLESRSPLLMVDKIQRPLLIGQGANDPRVKQPEADQIVKAMNERKIPVTYVLFHDEGHGFSRPPNRFAFYAITEAFLAQNLGGRFEPIGDAFTGADFSVPSGDDQVPGLTEKLKARPMRAAK